MTSEVHFTMLSKAASLALVPRKAIANGWS